MSWLEKTMNEQFESMILKKTGAESLVEIEVIQTLWSGYGKIIRYGLIGNKKMDSIIVKQVELSAQKNHPRGWDTDLSHQRKLRSYQIEMAWYHHWSQNCDRSCRVASCLALASFQNNYFMALEDLDASGFPERKSSVTDQEMLICLSWLANFHATFIGEKPEQLWPTGTYWHLQTRPDELEKLTDMRLKNAAELIDQKLNNTRYQTFVHGDAKLANFCFSSDGKNVAAVDFQYVGGGCGIKDVAYFIGSCLDEEQCQAKEKQLVDHYFHVLREALVSRKKSVDGEQLEHEWRALYPVAWTDFFRFLKGWSPGHWKIHSYSEQLAQQVVTELNKS